MRRARTALRDIARSPVRSGLVWGSAVLVAALGVAVVLLSLGTRVGVERVSGRLGADILVAPLYSVERIENSLMLGLPTDETIPLSKMSEVAAIEGVVAVSPQLYLTSLPGTPCCPEATTPIVAFDPDTDFVIGPWLDGRGRGSLGKDEAIGGSAVQTRKDSPDSVTVYGHELSLVGRMDPTGTSLDRTLYLTFQTAEAIRASSVEDAVAPLEILPGRVSAFVVRAATNVDPHELSQRIDATVEGVDAFAGNDLYRSVRTQAAVVERSLYTALAAVSLLCLALVVVAALMAARERRREMGVLRALGAPRSRVVSGVAIEGAALATTGSAAGVFAGLGILRLDSAHITDSLGIPLDASAASATPWLAVAVVVAVSVAVAAAYAAPLVPVAIEDPSRAMRER